MRALIHRMQTMSEQKFDMEGGRKIRVSPVTLRQVLADQGSPEDEQALVESGDSEIPLKYLEAITEAGGRVSGCGEMEEIPEDVMVMTRLAYKIARGLAKPYASDRFIEGLVQAGADLSPDALTQRAHDTAILWLSEAGIKEAYALLPSSGSQLDKAVFLDILSDIVLERMVRGARRKGVFSRN